MLRKNLLLKFKFNSYTFSTKSIIKQAVNTQWNTYNPNNIKDEKELIFKVLESIPSKREAKSYLNKVEGRTVSNSKTLPILLVHLSLPMVSNEIEQVMKTLAYIQKLGMYPILILDNLKYSNKYELINEGMNISQMMIKYNIKSRLISDGLLEGNDNMRLKVDLSPIKSSLKNNSIPIILPICSTTNTCKQFVTNSDYVLMAISKCFSRYADEPAMIQDRKGDVLKVMLINSRGGIPDNNNNIYSFINLQQQLKDLVIESNIWKGDKSALWKRDLDLAYSSLAYLPATTSAVVVSSSTIKQVISNIITDKPYCSPSLTKDRDKKSSGYTVLRYGLTLNYYNSLDQIDIPKMVQLLEKSFNKKLDVENYIKRLNNKLNHILVAGDYQGIAILTNEGNSTCYLDKFAVDPQSQGIGVSDILWQKLREHCPDLMWRSHKDNKVNKWYFDRSDGNLLLDNTCWRMFWYGKNGFDNILPNIEAAGNIQPSFFPNTV